MQNSRKKDDQSTDQSLAPLFIKCSSLWNSTEQPRYSPSKSTITGPESPVDEFRHVKQSQTQFQEQDSSSTLSACQSHYAIAGAATNSTYVQNIGAQHEAALGCYGTYGRRTDCHQRSPLSYARADYPCGQVQLEHNKSMAIPFPCAESYFGGLLVAFGPNAHIYPSMVGMSQARVPLPPLECAESIPVFVNAKQYCAILRRRQVRAKLEAQNKTVKFRKPYLHKSRHIHASRRPRGSGGRFLSSKNVEQSKLSALSYFEDISKQNFVTDTSGSEVQRSESGSWGASTPSGSDVTSIFNGDDIFQQPEIRVSTSSFRLGVPVGEDSTHLEAGNRLFLSIDRCAQK